MGTTRSAPILDKISEKSATTLADRYRNPTLISVMAAPRNRHKWDGKNLETFLLSEAEIDSRIPFSGRQLLWEYSKVPEGKNVSHVRDIVWQLCQPQVSPSLRY